MSDSSKQGDPQDYPQQLWTNVLSVALDTPLRRCFDYLPPLCTAILGQAALLPGMRVRVPFGRQQLTGIIVSLKEQSEVPSDKLKRILAVIDSQPVFDAQLLKLLTWTANYYHAPLGEVMATALPTALRGPTALQATVSGWRITESGHEALDRGELQRTPKQAKLLEELTAGPRPLKTDPSLRSLREKGWVE
ncbi:MAG: hypothetical protein EBS77_10970, partial [Gammaproteobacteria bacterium]|nr:hypothetical protein [Gammaproteobacteria bacterium]